MSSAQHSFLTSVGYDMVVATTQKALNATMLLYMSERDKIQPTTVYYVWQKKEDPKTHIKKPTLVAISLDELNQIAPGVNPFEISADADPASDVGLQRLRFAGFSFAYSITPGLPEGIAPQDMPNIIELGNQSSSVKYNMLCSDVKLCSLAYEGMDLTWQTFSQPIDAPWAFSCNVDLRMASDNDGSAFSKLDPSIQKKIRANLGNEDAFSVQQLLFDLDNAGLETVPTMHILGGEQTLDPIVAGTINGSFLGSYFADMHRRGQPLLHVAVVSKRREESEFRATDMTMQVARLLDDKTGKPFTDPSLIQQNLSTLNYLCMSKNHPLPALQQLKWNWMTEAESRQYHGVIAYSRNGFANMLIDQLTPLARKNCYIAGSKCSLNSGSIPQYAVAFKRIGDGQIINPQNRDDLRDWLNTQNASPAFKITEAPNSTVMELTWKQDPPTYDSAGSPVTLGYVKIQPSYSCQVEFKGNQVIITQRLIIWMAIMKSQDSQSGNIVDRTMTETFTLKVNDKGEIVSEMEVKNTDSSETPGTNGFMNLFNKLNDEIDMIRKATEWTATDFQPAPISDVQKFQFPGGKTFTFRDLEFSDNQDLTAGITYVDPVA